MAGWPQESQVTASPDAAQTETREDAHWPMRLVVAGGAILLAAGLFGWAVMGQSLYVTMATGLGWLCM